MSALRDIAAKVMLAQEVLDAWRARHRGDTTLEQFVEEINQSVVLYHDSTKERADDGNQSPLG